MILAYFRQLHLDLLFFFCLRRLNTWCITSSMKNPNLENKNKLDSALLTKIRKITGWALIIISTILMFISIFIATTGELLKGGGIYVASQLTWYPGLALLGPEIVQKSKEMWNNFIQSIKNGFTQK